MKLSHVTFFCLVALSVFLVPAVGYCSVEGTLQDVQSKLVGQILPLAAILGLIFSAFSFFTGNPNARSHVWLSIIGMCVGFGAESIMHFVQNLVH